MKQVNKKPPKVFYAGVILLFLVLFSSYMTGGLYARYYTTGSGSDEARVASFDVNIIPGINIYTELIELGDIQPGETVNIDFTVTNNSEVAVSFNVTAVNLTGNLPVDVPLKGSANANTPVFSQALGQGETADLTFSVVWDAALSDPAAAGKADLLELKFTVKQID